MTQQWLTNTYGKDAWLVFRIDTQIKDQPIDVYMLTDISSNIILAHELVITELSAKQADKLLQQGISHNKDAVPKHLILDKCDPAAEQLRSSAEKQGMTLELLPTVQLEAIVAPLKQFFGEKFYSPSSFGYTNASKNTADDLEQENAKQMIPDSYHPCPCASGKKYKFCCKPILREIVEAMVAAETGKLAEALDWISKAKEIVGETAEIVCRESVVYSFYDSEKSEAYLNKCLTMNPNHPRAHYLCGLSCSEKNDHQGAIHAYEKAIANYPASDNYHLNEVYNNLGVIYYKMSNPKKARDAWEKALLYLPSDETTQRNLNELIYRGTNPMPRKPEIETC